MQLARPGFAPSPLRFGRGRIRDLAMPAPRPVGLANDLRLFGSTFLVGFVFVSVLIA